MIKILFPFILGLALFFYGLFLMRRGLDRLSSKRWQEKISRLAKTPQSGFLTGMIFTALLQSSSAVTILIVGFVNAKLLTFSESIGLILGANVGTTVTLQILSFSQEEMLIPIWILGLLLWISPHHKAKQVGLTLFGLSMMLLSLTLMGLGTRNFLTSNLSFHFLQWIEQHAYASLITGIVATALIQSSTAVLAMTMIFLKSKVLSLPTGILILLGTNIGTCFDTYLSSLGGSKEGKKVAYAHILLNIGGVLLFVPLIHPFAQFLTHLSPHVEQQLAHGQTLFNLITSLFVLPFSEPFARLVSWLTGDRKEKA